MPEGCQAKLNMKTLQGYLMVLVKPVSGRQRQEHFWGLLASWPSLFYKLCNSQFTERFHHINRWMVPQEWLLSELRPLDMYCSHIHRGKKEKRKNQSEANSNSNLLTSKLIVIYLQGFCNFIKKIIFFF